MDSPPPQYPLDQRRFAAQLLRARAAELGGMLARRLLASDAALEKRYQPLAWDRWAENYGGLVLDLAAAVDAGRPELFAARAAWAGVAYASRGVPQADLLASFAVLEKELPGEMDIADAPLVREYVGAALAKLAHPCASPEGLLKADTPHGKLAVKYLMALLEGNRLEATSMVVDAVRAGMPVKEAYQRVLIPAQLEVGRMWHLNEINVAEEHIATATTQSVMAQLHQYAERKPPNGRAMIAACVEGNTHEMGVRVVADFFEFAGWRAISMGANVPSEDIGIAARDFGVDVVALSAALPVHMLAVESAVQMIRGYCQEKPARIILGGGGFAGMEDAWQGWGADGFAPDADAAVDLAERLVGLPG